MDNAVSRLLLVMACVASVALAATTAQAAATSVDGYEVTRSQTVVPVPKGKVGRKTIDRETRVGNTEETDGNSFTSTMTLGGFMHRCPVPEGRPAQFVISGDYEYSIVVDIVDTDVVPTKRVHHEKRVTAKIKVFVNDDLSIKEGEVDGEFNSNVDGVRTGPIPIRKRFPIRAYGTPDLEALRDIVKVTADLAAAALLWNTSTTVLDLQRLMLEKNACTELVYDPPSETRTVGPNETVEVKVKYWFREGQRPVPRGDWTATAGNGKVEIPNGRVPEDGTVVVRYTATSNPKTGDGFHVDAVSGAGLASEHWRIRTGLTLVIEHHLADRRDTDKFTGGWAVFSSDVRFEAQLDPQSTLPAEIFAPSRTTKSSSAVRFAGQVSVRRSYAVGHVTPRCAPGSIDGTEIWYIEATLDPATETLELKLDTASTSRWEGIWICDGEPGDASVDIFNRLHEQPYKMPAKSGSRQRFVIPQFDGIDEFLTVTVK